MLLLGHVFENLRNTCPETYELDSARFLTGKDQHDKNSKLKIDLLTNINMLLMVEKGIRGGICHAIH